MMRFLVSSGHPDVYPVTPLDLQIVSTSIIEA
jgi:hypothetical protein